MDRRVRFSCKFTPVMNPCQVHFEEENIFLFRNHTRPRGCWGRVWRKGYPRRESNPHLPFRRGPFYPLNYEDVWGRGSGDSAG